jgi:heme/copper-type cytochrome/quinol oxidase subunit 1
MPMVASIRPNMVGVELQRNGMRCTVAWLMRQEERVLWALYPPLARRELSSVR